MKLKHNRIRLDYLEKRWIIWMRMKTTLVTISYEGHSVMWGQPKESCSIIKKKHNIINSPV